MTNKIPLLSLVQRKCFYMQEKTRIVN